PAVSSLEALRRVGKPSTAPRPMIGFGNPLLDGYPGRLNDDADAAQTAKDHAQWAKEARVKQRCPEARTERTAARGASRAGGDAWPDERGVPQDADAAARDRRRAVQRGTTPQRRRRTRHPPRQPGDRARGEADKRERRARQVPHGALCDSRGTRRRVEQG